MAVVYNFGLYTENNRCPVSEFMDSRNDKERGKIAYYLSLLTARGPAIREPYSKKVSSEIHELRPSFANTEMRLMYFWDGGTAVILSGFIKKDRAAPRGEIKLAEARRMKYLDASRRMK